MARRTASLAAAAVCLVLGATACTHASAARRDDPVVEAGSTSTSTSSSTTTIPATTTTTTLPATTTTAAPPPLAPGRTVSDPQGAPFAGVGGVVLVHPSSRVEHIGFHQSSVDGAQELTVLPTAVRPSVLNTRKRGTGGQTAADVVVEPGSEIRAPVSGTVVKAGPYRLYCAYDDETVVIEPDAHPGWHVVMLHLQGVLVAAGQRVEAGATPVATQAHQLPFRSQVDRLRTASPAWPHVHIEVDDPAIPDRPSKGDSC
jgi:murein DD-endopeptidase MepM/ murein hydrolase activator NlpD